MPARTRYVNTSFISPRQADYVRLVFKGLSLLDIADRLCVSEKAVKWHVTELNKKFKTRRRSEWVAKYIAGQFPHDIEAQLKGITGLRRKGAA